MHRVTSLLLVNLLVVLQAHDGSKYEHSFLYEQIQKITIMTSISNVDKTTPIHYLVQSFNPLNAPLNPICHLLALLGSHHILHVSG